MLQNETSNRSSRAGLERALHHLCCRGVSLGTVGVSSSFVLLLGVTTVSVLLLLTGAGAGAGFTLVILLLLRADFCWYHRLGVGTLAASSLPACLPLLQ